MSAFPGGKQQQGVTGGLTGAGSSGLAQVQWQADDGMEAGESYIMSQPSSNQVMRPT
jgi:hypothetical protein